MKNLKFTAYILMCFVLTTGFVQDQSKAKGILDKVNKTFKSLSTLSADIKILIETEGKNAMKEEQSGKMVLKGDKYFLKLGNQEVYCNGVYQWTYFVDLKEVQKSKYEPSDDEISPNNLFKLYEKGFESFYINEEVIGGITYHVIDLVPTDKKKSFFKIKLWVDKNQNLIGKTKVFEKKGTKYTYSLTNMKSNLPVAESTFEFDAKKNTGVEMIDLTK